VTLGTITLTDETQRQVMVCNIGVSWGVACVPEDCTASIVGYTTRTQAVRGAEWHLRWHAIGKPTCAECGAWLTRKGSKRCRRGTCEVDL
jgi:hypothetical protein